MDENLTMFEELSTGQAFEYDGKIYFKATSQNGEDCGFCIEDVEVRFTFPRGVKELGFANNNITKPLNKIYAKYNEDNQ